MLVKSTEEKDSRLKRVDMHEFFLNRIEEAMTAKRYIEASWLIYSCFENRYFRTVEKIKGQCKYSKGKCKKNSNDLALRTKINCIKRLANNNCACFRDSFTDELFRDTLKWIKVRNSLMHNLLQLENYENMDQQFEENSKEGLRLLKETYLSCTSFRKKFYMDSYKFVFPEAAMEECQCKPRVENR